MAKEKAVSQVARLVWHSRAERNVDRIHRALQQFQFCNIAGGGAVLPQAKTKAVFTDALATLLKEKSISSPQHEALSGKLEAAVPEIAEYVGGSINKDALKLRFYGFLVFKHLAPDAEGLKVLRGIYEKPEEKEQGKKKTPRVRWTLLSRHVGTDGAIKAPLLYAPSLKARLTRYEVPGYSHAVPSGQNPHQCCLIGRRVNTPPIFPFDNSHAPPCQAPRAPSPSAPCHNHPCPKKSKPPTTGR